MVLQIFTWLVFLVMLVFAYKSVELPLIFYTFTTTPGPGPRTDLMMGWLWLTLLGVLPALVLLVLALVQRRSVPGWMLALWLLATGPTLVSAGFFAMRAL